MQCIAISAYDAYNRGMPHYTVDEPIYALATPFAPSALAVIRASGDGVLSMLEPLFTGKLMKAPTNTAVHGFLVGSDGRKIDEVVIIKYGKGHGYTSEEAFEIMCHGSLPVIRAISLALESQGIREAERGEFTYRAFMHGRMDLTEAEAVEEIVKSKSESASQDALSRLSGSIRAEADSIRSSLLDILASLEVQLDYGEDEIPEEWVFPHDEVSRIISRLESIAATYDASRLYSSGASVVLAGRTNAGKSSLYNAILKENRSIVSASEGTTRDYIETECLIGDIPVHLFDTAGLRDTDESIEREGIERTRKLMEGADLIVYVLDGNEEEPSGIDSNALIVRSKRDITGASGSLSFSSVTGEGIGDVLKAIEERLLEGSSIASDVPRIDSERQRGCLLDAASALCDAENAVDSGEDVVAMYIQLALSSLSALTGAVTSDELLDKLFSSFCLGK